MICNNLQHFKIFYRKEHFKIFIKFQEFQNIAFVNNLIIYFKIYGKIMARCGHEPHMGHVTSIVKNFSNPKQNF